MIDVLKIKYPESGQFNLKMGEKIKEVARKKGVPNGHGIYLIYEGNGCKGDPIYIGKSGTIKSDGTIGKQGIKQRLGKKRGDGVYGNEFFISEMKKRRKGLSFAWFITFDNSGQKTLPAYAEAKIMQNFYFL